MDAHEFERITGHILSAETRDWLERQARAMGLETEAEDCAQLTQIKACRKVMVFEGRSVPEMNQYLQTTNKRHALRIVERSSSYTNYDAEMGEDGRRRGPIPPSFGVRAGEASNKFMRAMAQLPLMARFRLQRRIVEKAKRESMIAELGLATPLQVAQAQRAKAEGRKDDPVFVEVERLKMQLTRQLAKDSEQLLDLLRREDFGPSEISLLRWKL